VLLACAYLALGSGYVVGVPLFEAPDEPSHVHYVGFVSHAGRAPYMEGEAEVPGEGMQPPLYYFALAPLFPRAWPRDPAPLLAELRNASLSLYRTQPAAIAGNRLLRAGPLGSVRFLTTHRALEPLRRLRWPGLGFGLAALGLTAFAVGRATRDPATGVLAGAILGLNPQFLFVSASVSNDAAAAAAGAACLAVLARALRDGSATPLDYGALALASALALMLKLSTAPMLAVSLALLLAVDRRALRLRLRDLAWSGALGLLLVAPLLHWNSLHRGDPLGWTAVIGSAAHLVRPDAGGSRLDYLVDVYAWKTFESYWARFGWMSVRAPFGLVAAFAAFTAAGLLGAALAARGAASGRAAGVPGRLLAYLAAAFLATLAAHVWLNLQTAQAQGRHLFPAAPQLAGLLAIGLRELARRAGPRAQRLLPFAVAGGLAAAALGCLLFVIAPAYPPP
jgi:4-amino-4-deoxy-L-arabinose transferase-like glycosyltransferase